MENDLSTGDEMFWSFQPYLGVCFADLAGHMKIEETYKQYG